LTNKKVQHDGYFQLKCFELVHIIEFKLIAQGFTSFEKNTSTKLWKDCLEFFLQPIGLIAYYVEPQKRICCLLQPIKNTLASVSEFEVSILGKSLNKIIPKSLSDTQTTFCSNQKQNTYLVLLNFFYLGLVREKLH
jgi:hypothetical protein